MNTVATKRLLTLSAALTVGVSAFAVSTFVPSDAFAAAGMRYGAVRTSKTTPGKKGYFDGKSYELSLYVSPTFGYESNYKYTNADIEGSAFFAASAGAELKYRPSSKLYLRGELSAGLLMPLADTSLTGFIVELPLLLFYKLTDDFQLFVSNHIAVERERSPPVFFDTDVFQSLIRESKTIVYLAVYEQLRPAVAWRPLKNLMVDAGPYFRVKQVQFNQNPADSDPDYRLFDVGGDIAVGYRFLKHFRVRAHYDFAYRIYQNIPPRESNNLQIAGEELRALRHYADIRLGYGTKMFSVFAGYGIRLNSDNGGSLDYTEHHLLAGAGFFYKELFSLTAQVSAASRSYNNRTPCEASRTNPTDRTFEQCLTGPNAEKNAPQSTGESLIGARAEAVVNITDWMQVMLTYEMEDAGASGASVPIGSPIVEDPQGANHRVMGGVSLSI